MAIDHDIKPVKKTKEWISNCIKEYWNDFKDNSSKLFYNNRDEMEEIRAHLLGHPDIEKYKKLLIPSDGEGNDNDNWMNINWEPLPIVSKFSRVIADIVKKLRYSPRVHAIDAEAREGQDKFYSEIAAKILLKEELAKLGISPEQAGLYDPQDASDFEELEMEMEYSWKDNQAKKVEKVLAHIMENSRYDEIRDRLIMDLIHWGIAVVEDFVDHEGEIFTEYRDPTEMVFPVCEEPDFSDAEYGGHVRLMTMTEISNASSDDDMRSEAYDELKELMSQKAGSAYSNGKREGNKVQVLHLKFLSTNHQIYEFREGKDGKMYYGKETSGKKDKKFKDAYFDVVYEGYWVIDSDYFFGCKLSTDMKRDPHDLKVCKLPFNVYAPEIFSMHTYSLGRQMINISDNIHIAHYKLQDAIIRAKPSGVIYNFTSLRTKLGGEDQDPADLIKTYHYTGNFGYEAMDEDGNVLPWMPISELQGGLKGADQEYFNVIHQNIQLLREVTGLNEITDGSGPDPKILKSVAQLASLSTNNSLRYLHESEKKLTDRVATSLMMRIQDAARSGDLDIYKQSVGSNTVEHIKLTADVAYRKLGLYFEEEPSQEDKERLERDIQLALAPQGEHPAQITLADAYQIRNVANMKNAEQLLAYKVKKNREKNEQQRMRLVQENAKAQQDSVKVAEEEKRRTKEHDHKLEMDRLKFEKLMDLRIKAMELRARTAEQGMENNIRESESIRSNNTKEMIAEKQAEQRSKEQKSNESDSE